MEDILKSIAGKAADDYIAYLRRFLDPETREILSTQELPLLEYMLESFENSGVVPSAEYLALEFPEFEVPLQNASELSLTDLKVAFANLVTKRTRQQVSSELMAISSEVSKTGLTYEHLEEIRKYVHTADEEIIDYTESPDMFRRYYAQKKEQPTGLVTFIRPLDEAIGGIGYGMMATVAAFVASFKSTWCANIAYLNTHTHGLKYNICYISLEVSKEDMLINQLTRHSNDPKFDRYPYIPAKKVRDCLLTEDEEEYLFNDILNDYYDYSQHGMLKVLDETDFHTMSFGEIRQKIEDVDDEMRQVTGYGLDAVIVDHVNLLKFNGSGMKFSSEYAMGNAYVSFFRKLALSFRQDEDGNMRKLMMLIVAQINRQGKAKADKHGGRYELNALAEFNEIERGSQVVMTIYTTDEMKEAKEATVQLLKNRNGPTIEEPLSVYADGASYTFGDEMEGFNAVLEGVDMGDVFGGDTDITDLF